MFGIVQGVGVAAPFALPSASQPGAAQFAPARSKSTAHAKNKRKTTSSFRDDTHPRLVALRYEQTQALEEPIPLPPPRSPLRQLPSSSSSSRTRSHTHTGGSATHSHAHSFHSASSSTSNASSQRQSHSHSNSHSSSSSNPTKSRLRPSSYIPSPSTGAVAPFTAASGAGGAVPPPRPPPPAEQHPALRTISSPRQPDSEHSLRDPSLAPSSSTRSHTYYDADTTDDEDDPFAYENIENIDFATRVQPLQLTQRSPCSSIYSLYDRADDIPGQQPDEGEAESRPSETFSSPALSLSASGTASPTIPASPATPPPQFTKRFGRSLSLRSGSSKKSSSMKKLRKKSLQAGREAEVGGSGDGGKSGNNTNGINEDPLPPPVPDSCIAPNPIHPTNISTFPHSPLSDAVSPVISTNIPCESFFEEDDLTKLSFSIRGSLIFGGRRPWKTTSSHPKMPDRDAIAEQPERPDLPTHNARVFPLVPTATKNNGPRPVRPPRQDDMGVADIIQPPTNVTLNANPASSIDKDAHVPEPSQARQPAVVKDTPSTPTSTSGGSKLPPSIRVISAEAEKESQKVRSLYEFGEGLHPGDGDRPSSFGELLEPTPEVPSDVDENDAANDAPRGHPTQTAASTSSQAPPDNQPRRNHQLAGGIEDWEGVDGEDVDRYGFIVTPRLGSPTTTPNDSSSVTFSPQKRRNVLTRKDAASHSLGVKHGPSKKASARSLNTQNSELSSVSRRSVRSTIRQATNKLPHNRDRRLVDEAGDILALHPGLSHIREDETAEKVALELKRKEAERSDKWRKMAHIVKSGSDGRGTVFDFDTKHPKLISRTWKGIPDCWRSAAWYAFLATSAKADSATFKTDAELKDDFTRLVDEPSPDDTQIDLDVPRTINQHIMFRRRYRGGQRLLFRVLHCLSLYFPDTGYVQGMAPLAATLLSYYDEETCFVMLVRLWQYRGLNRIYQSGFVELIDALNDFEQHWLHGKDVSGILKELSIGPTAYATRWYLTLFNLSIPFPVQLRVWDVFMLLGSSPPERPESEVADHKSSKDYVSSAGLEILHATSLAIIDTLQPALADADFENAMKSLTSWVPIKDEQKFLEVVQIEWKKHQSRQKKKA
ncbi:rab-GTPase-TBC domain-containing protein [Xylariaceae sp. FL1272]|nr:rab-GTPase-TBC domain-containing protein [Xylariaceae sp. FL1272]